MHSNKVLDDSKVLELAEVKKDSSFNNKISFKTTDKYER